MTFSSLSESGETGADTLYGIIAQEIWLRKSLFSLSGPATIAETMNIGRKLAADADLPGMGAEARIHFPNDSASDWSGTK
jgi:hypothetical protein